MVAAHPSNGPSEQGSIVGIRGAHGALLVVIAAEEGVLLWICLVSLLLWRNLTISPKGMYLRSCVMVLSFLLRKLLLLFNDSLLRLVIELHEEALGILGRQLLPDEEALASIQSCLRVGITDRLLDVLVNCLSMSIKDALEWIEGDEHIQVLRHLLMERG